jgi:hypothetical protein
MTALATILVLWAVANAFTIAASVNMVRWLKLMGLGSWTTYPLAVGWGWFGFFGVIRWSLQIYILATAGVPESFKGVDWATWLNIGIGFPFALYVSFASAVAVRNAKQMQAEQREETRRLHKALFRLREAIDEVKQ